MFVNSLRKVSGVRAHYTHSHTPYTHHTPRVCKPYVLAPHTQHTHTPHTRRACAQLIEARESCGGKVRYRPAELVVRETQSAEAKFEIFEIDNAILGERTWYT